MNEDSFLYCDKHCDLWQAGCPRCEVCCQHHYGCSVKEKFNDDGTLEKRAENNWRVFQGNNLDDMHEVPPSTIL